MANDRFSLELGKYGAYFRDNRRGIDGHYDLTLDDVLNKLNWLEEYTTRLETTERVIETARIASRVMYIPLLQKALAAYDEDEVKCPYAKSNMTPCAQRDGIIALTDDEKCVGCGIDRDELEPITC